MMMMMMMMMMIATTTLFFTTSATRDQNHLTAQYSYAALIVESQAQNDVVKVILFPVTVD